MKELSQILKLFDREDPRYDNFHSNTSCLSNSRMKGIMQD
jgi:hypothetical protein